MKNLLTAALLLPTLSLPIAAHADEPTHVTLAITNHVFDQPEIHVPANKPVIIEMTNNDKTAEEFDSDDLHTEKVAAGGKKVTIRIGPQKPGTYKFSGEYHEKTAHGVLIAE